VAASRHKREQHTQQQTLTENQSESWTSCGSALDEGSDACIATKGREASLEGV